MGDLMAPELGGVLGELLAHCLEPLIFLIQHLRQDLGDGLVKQENVDHLGLVLYSLLCHGLHVAWKAERGVSGGWTAAGGRVGNHNISFLRAL